MFLLYVLDEYFQYIKIEYLSQCPSLLAVGGYYALRVGIVFLFL